MRIVECSVMSLYLQYRAGLCSDGRNRRRWCGEALGVYWSRANGQQLLLLAEVSSCEEMDSPELLVCDVWCVHPCRKGGFIGLIGLPKVSHDSLTMQS